MRKTIREFLLDTDGAVTVDWVVLTAAIVGLGMAVLMPIAFTTDSAAVSIGNSIGSYDAGYTSSRQ